VIRGQGIIFKEEIMKTMKIRIFTIMVCVAAMATGVFADAKSEAHARRKARNDSVVALLKDGDATEGENGYLQPKQGLAGEKMAVVEAENKDRKTGYEAIAKEHKASVEAISKAAGKINRRKAEELDKKE
jgi:uncharacterized protein YdbL (DUF1318 family)